jgi:branched-chain amino acid transport system permease protein
LTDGGDMHNFNPTRSELIQIVLAIALIVVTGLLPDLMGSKYWSLNFQLVNIVIAAAVFQNFLMYDANQISFGQGAIFGLGAYVTAMSVASYDMPWIVAVMIAAVAAAAGGALFALPALRVQGYYLGFVTLSAAMVFPELLFALDRYTNGINGISVAPGHWHDNIAFGISPLSLATAAAACFAIIFHVAIRHSAFGRKIKIAGASPEAAQTLGIRPGLVRSIVFITACVGTGIAGALYTPAIGFVTPAAFHLELSILLFLAVIVGGRGHIIGPLTGIYLLYLLPNVLLVELVDYRLLAYGALALLIMLAMPDGIVGTIQEKMRARVLTNKFRLSPDTFPIPNVTRTEADEIAVSIRGATKLFGAVTAMDQVDLDIERGSIVGLVGGNGSGKTTLLNTITGFSRVTAGNISIRGKNVTGLAPAHIAHLGVGRTFQTPRIFESLTAWENIVVGAECPLGRHHLGTPARLDLIERDLAEIEAETIPHGQRRSMELLRVLLTGADVLLLDEPAAGLSLDERKSLSSLLLRLKHNSGKTILFVEHDLDLVWGVADKIAVMDNGKLVACGLPRDMTRDPAASKLFIRHAHA